MARPNLISKAFACAKFFSRLTSCGYPARDDQHKRRETKRTRDPAEVPSAKRRPNSRQIRFKWYEKIDLPVGYVGLVRRM